MDTATRHLATRHLAEVNFMVGSNLDEIVVESTAETEARAEIIGIAEAMPDT